jgi:xylulokinase
MRFLLGIDIGTQGVKAAVYGEDGIPRAEAFRPSDLQRPAPGAVEEDPERQLQSSLQVLRECVEKSGIDPLAIAGLGIAGQMAGVIGIGADGKALTPYDSWLDTRCSAYVRRMQQEAGDEVTEKAGNPPSFNHGPKILWWKHERPAEYARIFSFVQPSGYVAMRLCALEGRDAFIDKTYLHFSGFADSRKLVWDAELCRRFDLDLKKLPRIVEPHAIIGKVTPAMAQAAGIPAGLPVVAGCGDTAASFLSCGATREGICVDVAGTASVFAATTAHFIADTTTRILGCGHSVTPGLWHPYAYINGGGQNLEWFRTVVLSGQYTLEELNRQAADASADARLPYFIPHLGGRVSPNWPDLRGGWLGLDWDTTPGMLYRSMLEGVALEYGLYKRALQALLPAFTMQQIRITGGGEKSAVWNQLKADRLQSQVAGILRSGGAPMGAALIAGQGVALFSDLAKTANQWIELGRVTAPDPSVASLSEQRINRYAMLLNSVNAWSEEGWPARS